MSIDDIATGFDRIITDMLAAAERAVRRTAPMVEAHMQATHSYRDVTGATRAGTVAFVVTREDDGSAAFDHARSAFNQESPGRSYSTTGPEADAETPIMILATVPSEYVLSIEQDRGGARAFIGPAIDALGPVVWAEVERELAGVFHD